MKRPVWLFSMDSEQFHAPPTTTASLKAYYRRYSPQAGQTQIELVHFRDPSHINDWLQQWRERELPLAREALLAGLQPVIGFSFYTWNAAEFLELVRSLKSDLPELLSIAGGPHVQQAEDYLGQDPFDLIVMGEGEITFQQALDAADPTHWAGIPGLAMLRDGEIYHSAERERCRDLDQFPSPLDELELCDTQGNALYEAISYETSRGCPFRCAFCEWGTGAIGSKMYQWSMARIERDWQSIIDAGIQDLWLADSNFGALKQDLDKARLITEHKRNTGLPRSFATSWSKKHSRQVQEIALLLHEHELLPHYQLALQTLTPEALRLSNRSNMSSNQYQPIAKHMSEQGVPIAAELIWGLPGDNLPDFESNLDQLLATFPNINIFGYTLLPGTEFYARREEYRIEAIPVAGYGKAKGEYVVGCHSFDRDQGEEGYFLISAHLLLIHGHVMPLTTRLLALERSIPVSAMLRAVLRALIGSFAGEIPDFDGSDRMQVYESRNALYLAALADPDRCFAVIQATLAQWLAEHDAAPGLAHKALQLLRLDAELCPRTGAETSYSIDLGFDARSAQSSLAAMDLPADSCFDEYPDNCQVQHPGGVGEILFDADGGSWLQGKISAAPSPVDTSRADTLAVPVTLALS
ncbi:MAG: cobalamin-dependent protein [Halieaceae bacterium]